VTYCGCRGRHFDALAGKTLVEVVGQALRSRPHCVAVHFVGAYADQAPQSPGTKFEVFVEGIGQFTFVVGIEQGLDAGFGFGVVVSVEPGVDSLAGTSVNSLGHGSGVSGDWVKCLRQAKALPSACRKTKHYLRKRKLDLYFGLASLGSVKK
jgi:hypothetical protein